MTTDDDFQRLFAPIQRCEPPRADPGALAETARRRRRRRARPAATLAVTGLIAAALAALPAGGTDDPARSPAAGDVLASAAAVAAAQPPLADADGYRYERRRTRRSFSLPGDDGARITIEQTIDHWENAELDGRQVQHPARIVAESGDPATVEKLRARFALALEGATISARIASGGLGPLPELERLPNDPDALRTELEHHVRTASSWAPGALDEAMLRFEVAAHAQRLLSTAAAAPSLRAATFLMLSRLPGVTELGERRASDGRTGHAVELRLSGRLAQPTRSLLVFDPETSELIEASSTIDPPPSTPGAARTETSMLVEASGQVAAVGDRA